jgi:putative phosphoesterase
MNNKFGILGDIHTEDLFLELAINFFKEQNVSRILSVGDIVDGNGNINKCIELLRNNNVIAVRGNHERWILNNEMRQLPDANYLEEVDKCNIEYLKSLPTTYELEINDEKILLCHGLDDDDMKGVLPYDYGYAIDANVNLQWLDTEEKYKYIINGHTHMRMVRKFEFVTIINAGTLFHRHNPCILITDFEKKYALFHNIENNKLIPAEFYNL